MNADSNKQKRSIGGPTKNCQYGSNCYRKNPNHFMEYAHDHLNNILLKRVENSSNEYTIPDDLFLSKDIILEQLKILEILYPKNETCAKKPKLMDPSTSRAVDNVKVEAESSKLTDSNENAHCSSASTKKVTAIQLQSSLETTMLKIASTKLQNSQEKQKPNVVQNDNDFASSSTAAPSVKTTITKNIHDYISVVVPKGKMAQKLQKAAPYNFFLTTITASKPTYSEPLSITFQEILDPSLGDLESSVQINFMVDIGWVLGHYYFAECLDKPLLVLYGEETPDLMTISMKKPQVTTVKVHMSSPFGTHHTKMMLLGYKDNSMRVVVSTANLVEDDWHNRTQGLWISPKCERLPDDSDTISGDSPTGFREDLVRYLIAYNIPKLQPWIARIKKTNFKDVNVFFVASIPGGHRDTPKGHLWGHARVGYLLSKHSAPIDDSCPIIAQCSSIGSLGPNVHSWILADIANSFRKDSAPLGIRKVPAFKMIYPSFSNVKNSHDDLLGGGCLPYRKVINDKQPWLKNHLHQWKSRERFRSQAMPHIKTYCRWSDRGLYWFMLTSANLSKAAWGAFNKGAKIDMPLRIMSYEAGVLFLPKFVSGEDKKFFPMHAAIATIPQFPMPYDIPLIPYATEDTPFVMDYIL